MKYRIDLFITCKSQNGNYKICESKLTVEKIREYAIIYKLLQSRFRQLYNATMSANL